MEEKIYPDTAQGAKQALIDMCDHTWASPERINASIALRDNVEGVWGLKNVSDQRGAESVMVYLAGYREPSGKKREYNDFEPGTLR